MEVTMEDQVPEEGAIIDSPPKLEKSAYDKLQQTRMSAEEIVTKMLSSKKEGNPKPQLREFVTEMFLNFVSLRQANRSILLEEDRVKAETESAKGPVDFTTLQLHNLMYEKSHYMKAIKSCKDFKSKHPDIELVPEEEFFRDAPEKIKNSTMSNDKEHDLMLKRLNFELFQCKELCKLHEKLEQQKKGLLETIANRKKFLSSLPSHLKSLKKASLPVQHQLGVLHTKKLKQHHLAELLPPPLYVIYSQFLAQKEAFGEHVDLEIIGSVKEAQAIARQQANKDTGTTNTESSKLEDDAPEDEDDGQRRRKRPKKVASKESHDQSGVYQIHPLKVILHIHDDEGADYKSAKLIVLKFEYLLKLNVVSVGVEGSHEGPENNVLCNLFPDDTGLELPHQTAKLCAGEALAFDEKRTSRPYKWVQHLAGIDFLPETSPLLAGFETAGNETSKHAVVVAGLSLYRQQNRVHTVVQRIRSRIKAHQALAEQLDLLMKLKWPELTCERVPWAIHSPVCSLRDWSPLRSSANQASLSLPSTDIEQVQEPLNADMEEPKSGVVSKEEVENAREDGELPSLLPSRAVTGVKSTPQKGRDLDHSRQLSLISKSMVSPMSKAKSLSFRKHDEDSDIMLLDSESDLDEPAPKTENEAEIGCSDMAVDLWADYGIREFRLVLARAAAGNNEENTKLEAKIIISKEYPLRPPLFALSLHAASVGENHSDSDGFGSYNELRAIEAEVNVHVLKMIPPDQENFTLGHQITCLAMLFDFFMEGGGGASKMSNSVVDVGLCKPVSGMLLARTFRGRDRRKMISWKDIGCTPGYPY